MTVSAWMCNADYVYACVYIAVACVYDLYTEGYTCMHKNNACQVVIKACNYAEGLYLVLFHYMCTHVEHTVPANKEYG